MGRNDHLFSHNDGFIHLCYVLRNISRNQVMISVTRHCCFSSWSTEHRNPSAVLSNDVGWKADVSAGDKFSKTRQLDGWVARPQTRKIMCFSFFLDSPPPPHTHTFQLHFMKPIYESVVCYQFIWFCVMTMRVWFAIFSLSAWVFVIFHVDAFVLVCQLVLPSQLPWSLLWLLFITLSKQNGYSEGTHFVFF